MAAAAAEQTHIRHNQEQAAYFAVNAERDFETRRRLMKVLGAVAYEGAAASIEQAEAEHATLATVAEDYFSEDQERAEMAKARLSADLRTNVFEILAPMGHVSCSTSSYEGDGFYQNGYSQRAMYAHGTLHGKGVVERERRELETLNELRIEDGFLNGFTETHYFVETSRAPDEDEMPGELAEDNGYNVDWRIGKLRLTEVQADGIRNSYTASLMGVDKEGNAYDKAGVANIHQELGLDLGDASATAQLGAGFWVPKDRLPRGIADVVELNDRGLPTEAFFGSEGEDGDYDTVLQESLEREARIATELDGKVAELAQKLRGASCKEALLIMGGYAKDYATELCSVDTSYDPAQFGAAASADIMMAREHARNGDMDSFQQMVLSAQANAIVFMCGMRVSSSLNPDGTPKTESNSGTCDYISKECPLCEAKQARTHETSAKIECKECNGFVKKKAVRAASADVYNELYAAA